MSDPLILGIETSCDETGVAVLSGNRVLSSVLATQVEEHARFGGILPEIAARAHVEAIRPLVHQALNQAAIHHDDLDAVAVTRGPGLVGALAVGYAYGKTMAWTLGKPLIGVDHMEGHLFAPLLDHSEYEPPAVVVLVSGGHSMIVHMRAWGDYRVMGQTLDDAAGEAFDKLARFMGLGYPGGPAIDLYATGGDPDAIAFPRPMRDRPYDFSFSGLKTSVVTFLEKAKTNNNVPPLEDVCASIQEAIVDSIVNKTFNAVETTGVEIVAGGGGVLANRRLRQKLQEEADRWGVNLLLPSPSLCTDNGAMIAAAGRFHYDRGVFTSWASDVDPNMRIGQ